jgi:uncharacterized protein YcbX
MSCPPLERQSAQIYEGVFQYDRLFTLIDEHNQFISHQTEGLGPLLAGIRPQLHTYKGSLSDSFNGRMNLSVEGHGDIELSMYLPPHKAVYLPDQPPDWEHTEYRQSWKPVDVIVHGRSVTGAVVSKEANEMLSDYFGHNVRLVRDLETGIGGFADGYSMLLASQKSLAELSRQAPQTKGYENGMPMNVLQPHLIVDGDELEPYAEEHWHRVRIGDLTATVEGPHRQGHEREGDAKGILLGQKLKLGYRSCGQIAIGDLVNVEAKAVPA